jgi:hypothetical protein
VLGVGGKFLLLTVCTWYMGMGGVVTRCATRLLSASLLAATIVLGVHKPAWGRFVGDQPWDIPLAAVVVSSLLGGLSVQPSFGQLRQLWPRAAAATLVVSLAVPALGFALVHLQKEFPEGQYALGFVVWAAGPAAAVGAAATINVGDVHVVLSSLLATTVAPFALRYLFTPLAKDLDAPVLLWKLAMTVLLPFLVGTILNTLLARRLPTARWGVVSMALQAVVQAIVPYVPCRLLYLCACAVLVHARVRMWAWGTRARHSTLAPMSVCAVHSCVVSSLRGVPVHRLAGVTRPRGRDGCRACTG